MYNGLTEDEIKAIGDFIKGTEEKRFKLPVVMWWEAQAIKDVWNIKPLDLNIGPELQAMLESLADLKRWEEEIVKKDWQLLNSRIEIPHIISETGVIIIS